MNMRWISSLALALAVALPASAFAEEDPPSRVGRVAWLQGDVSVFADPERGWEQAFINSPLTSENSLWTEPGARAELRIGSTALRLDEGTQLDMRQLDDEMLRAHVSRGRLSITVRHFEPDEQFHVSTPNGRLILRANGRYRIESDPDRGESLFTVLAGEAQLDVEGRRVDINRGDAVRANDRGQFDFERASAGDFDDWARERDNRLVAPQAERYVSPRMTGYEDLDAYGTWNVEPEYGAVWYPSGVDIGYVPYRNGHWTHVRPWGWTWVDYAPWGYAPFHYGRWVYVGNRWGWHPGRYVARPVWAPALVGWVGSPGWSITIGTGSAPAIGWYPLAPWERYQPWYRTKPRYVNNVNGVVINRPPRAREYPGNRDRGATVTTREVFVSQRPVTRGLAPVPGNVVSAQPVVSGTAVLPSRNELRPVRPLAVERQGGASPAVSGQSAGSVPQPVPQPSVLAPAVPAYVPPVGGQSAQPARAPVPQTKPFRPPEATQPAPALQGRQNLQPAPSVQARPMPQATPQVQTAPLTRPAPQVQTAPLVRPAPQVQQAPLTRPAPAAPQVREQPVIRQQAPVQAPPVQSGRVVAPPQPQPVPQAAPQAQPQAKPKPQALEKPEAEPKPTPTPGRAGLVR